MSQQRTSNNSLKLFYRVGQKRGHSLCFTASNFRSIDQIGTKFGANQRYIIVILNRYLFELISENKVAPSSEWQWL